MKRFLSIPLFLLALVLAAPWAAQALQAGPRAPVFAASDGGGAPAVASGVDGGFAVLWLREDGTLAVRAFTASGAPAGPEHTLFRPEIDGSIRLDVGYWDLAALPAGGYVAVWEEVTAIVTSFISKMRLQRLEPSGQPARAPRTLDQPGGGFAELSAAVDPAGVLTILWDTEWFWDAQRFSLDGARQSAPIVVARDPTFDRVSAAAILPDGGFAVAGVLRRNGPQKITVLRLRPDGTATGPAVLAHADRDAERDHLFVAASASGHFVVAWRDLTTRQILARLFGTDGQPLGSEIAVATLPEGVAFYIQSVSVQPGGSFLVQWSRGGDLLASAFGSDGRRLGGDAALDSSARIGGFSVDAAPTPGGWVSTWSLATAGPPAPASSGPWFRTLTLPCGTGAGGAPSLCLHGNRFRAEVTWRVSPTEAEGLGNPIPLTGDTGAFWFFAPSNYELVVKVLDGRGVNGHFWVFYGSVTDVAFDLTVTDTVTGEQRTYRNPAGTMASRADTVAF